MSFKREGDDPSQLNLLKKRRVAELLASDIPDDEALLMRNGRYACTVCGHRPVFDTVDMLTIHRQGKKHRNCLEYHHARKRRFAQEVQKRRQEMAVQRQDKGETEAPLLQKTKISVRNALLKAAPYDSRSKPTTQTKAVDASTGNTSSEKKGLFFQTTRTQRLQLLPTSSSKSDVFNNIDATPTCGLPGNINSSSPPSRNDSSLLTKNKAKPSTFGKMSAFATDIDNEKPKAIQLQPYIPKAKRTSNSQQNYQKPIIMGPTLLPVPLHKNYKPYIASWEQSHSGSAFHDECNTVSMVTDRNSHDAPQSNTIINSKPERKPVSEQSHLKEHNNKSIETKVMKELLKKDAKKNTALEQVQQALIGKKTEKPANDKLGGRPNIANSSGNDPLLAEQRRKEMQHHLHLTSSGWKRDPSGTWVKDEDVEFDSDEEAPPE